MSESTNDVKVVGNVKRSVVIAGDNNRVNISVSNFQESFIPFGVPYQRNRYFTGRVTVLKQLHDQLTAATQVAITQAQAINGLGGIGKTQTAVEYAYRYHYDQCFYETVFWVKADTKVNLATDFAAIANQIALPIAQLGAEATQAEKIPAVQTWLATNHNWLLIFDNADTPSLLTDFIPTNPHGKVLITSRANIFDQLNIGMSLALEILSPDEAIALLFERTGYERTGRNVAAATEINKELDGLPLALEQASAFIVRRKISFEVYLSTYHRRGLSQLEKEMAKTGQYPSSVRQTWAMNIAAATAENPAAAALLELSAFLAPDEIPYHLLITGKAYLGEVLSPYLCSCQSDEAQLAISELLAVLSQYSLVKWEPDKQVYSVHRLVQTVIRDDMSQTPADRWLKQATASLVAAYPGGQFEYWEDCARLLPHWLKIAQQTQEMEYASEALGTLLFQSGTFLRSQGRYSEAKPLLLQALALRQRILGDEHLSVAESLGNLALLYWEQGHYRKAESLCRESLTKRRHLLGNEHLSVAEGLNDLALFCWEQKRYNEAETIYMESLNLRRQLLDDEHSDVVESLNNLALLYYSQGQYNKAEALALEVFEYDKHLLGSNHLGFAISSNNLALIYLKQKRYSESEPLFLQALRLRQQLFDNAHPSVAESLSNLALLYSQQGRYGEAESFCQKGLAMYKKLLGDEHPDVAESLRNLALVYLNQGRYDEAESFCQKSLAMYKRLFSDEHPDAAESLSNLALVYYQQGNIKKSKPLYARALGFLEQALGPEHPWSLTCRKNLEAANKKANKN